MASGRFTLMTGSLFLILIFLNPGARSLEASAEGGIGKEVKAQIHAESGLRLNREWLTALNPVISNYGGPEEKKAFKHIVNHYLLSQINFLALRFNKAFQEVRLTQLLMIQLLERVLKTSATETRNRLLSYGSRVIYGRNSKTKKYMSLAIRDLQVAEQKSIKQKHMRPWLYALKLNELVEAIKLVRHASRYYVLIIIELDSIYPRPHYASEHISYEEGRQLLTSGFPDRRNFLLLLHDDNYFKVGTEKISLLDQYQENPELDIINEKLPGYRLKDIPR